MPFLIQGDNFMKGFECGQMWTKMEAGFNFKDYIFHAENDAQVRMMLKRFGYSFVIKNEHAEWSYLTAEINN